ncbi:MAG: pseudouridine-5'-phosphate glycosidase [Pseudomonadota bacterium]
MKLDIAADVRDALNAGIPVIAMETTVITHGMGWPDNLEVTRDMQAAIRATGAVPAVLAVVDGQVTVGLNDEQLEHFARSDDDSTAKCSRRDLPGVVGLGRSGSLTVSATALVAHAAGIEMFATGGIGGVHRGHPFDVSTDLTELARTPVAGVCAGAKSILDLELTLEVLETHGVPVVGVGTDTLPAFYARSSDYSVPIVARTSAEAAAILRGWRELDAGNGLLFTVPVPEAAALSAADTEQVIERAVAEADEQGIRGNAITPWVLARVVELTDGRSLTTNKALLVNNARVAAEIAVGAKP